MMDMEPISSWRLGPPPETKEEVNAKVDRFVEKLRKEMKQMPHDKNGNVLAAGDEVIVRAKVTQVHTGEEYCNLTVETVEPMFPGDVKSTLTLNTKQVEKA